LNDEFKLSILQLIQVSKPLTEAVIGLPVLVILVLILMRLLKGLRALTGMDDKELMHPR
jgi:hypothetical protein